jgi:MscS family membrane protein
MSLLRIFVLVLMALANAPASAQLQAQPEAEATVPVDALGRETPRGTVTGVLRALAARNYTLAANYFALPSESDAQLAKGAELAQKFQAALDAGGTLLAFGALSNEPSGRPDDGLPADSEQVGAFGQDRAIPILLSRSEGPSGAAIWLISPETIEEMRRLTPGTGRPQKVGGGAGPVLAGAPLNDWGLLLAVAAGSFFAFWLMSAAILALLRAIVSDREKSLIYRLTFAALPPLSLFLSVVSFQVWAGRVEVSIVARQFLLRYIGVVAWIALAWFALRLVDALSRTAMARMKRNERRQAVSVIALLRRAAKVVLLAMAMVAVLDTFGFDVTTGIAALGIGGLALALGAQKTVENLVGSVTVIADRPVQVGDFCRVGDVVGTVEDIGMRSTRLRTNDRTIVTIPNGEFSSREIENFAKRDRFLFNPVIGLEYGVSAAKLREGVEIIERVLMVHPQVDSEGVRAGFADFGPSSLDIEVWSYIIVSDFAESRAVRQELLLTIMERLEEAGLAIAFPTRKVHLVQDGQ